MTMFLVDGSNLLGSLRKDRLSDETKRELASLLARYARLRKASIVCFFDGAAPASFARTLGSVKFEFTHPRSADDRIAEEISRRGGQQTVVTSDLGLASRVRSRRVVVLSALEFGSELERMSRLEGAERADSGDWNAWFADPKNREDF